MRPPALITCLLAFVTVGPQTSAEAQTVTFRATATVSHVRGNEPAVTAFLARFPVGTPIELTYTFAASTPDTDLDSTLGLYDGAVTALAVTIGSYSLSASSGSIGVGNDAAFSVQMQPQDPVFSCHVVHAGSDIYINDEYWMDSTAVGGAEPVPGFTPSWAYLDVMRTCAPGTNPADMLDSDALPQMPPELGSQEPDTGVEVRFASAQGTVAVYGRLTSLILMPSEPPPNTDVGSAVLVSPFVALPNGTAGSVSLTFDTVSTAGTTSVTSSGAGQPPPSGFKLTNPPVYYEIQTTATFSGSVRVCLGWTEGQVANEQKVSIFHYEANQWANITDPASRDTVNNKICGTASSLSPFTLFDVKYPFTGFLQPVDNLPTVNAIKAGSAVPVRFGLGGDLGLDIFALGYPKAQLMQCLTGEPIASIEETVTAGSSSVSYDVATDAYTYVWKTDKSWANSCRELQVKLTDGEVYTARFTMRK